MSDVRDCAQCGKLFVPRREHARFCSADCRVAWNHAHVSSPSTSGMPLDWAMAAMSDTVDRLMRASGCDQPNGFAVITEAVWWVTMVDATVVRYRQAAYGQALASQSPARRKVIEGTFAGLRFVRNRMGYEADCADFIQDGPSPSSRRANRVADWQWKAVGEPPLSSLTASGQQWELDRYTAYQAQLAGRAVGEAFAQAATFLQAPSIAAPQR
jgi:hypothetical protein